MDNQKTTGRNRLSELMESSLEGVRGLVDANTVIGDPIVTPNSTIIPISKMSVGFAGGGNDYAGKNTASTGKNNFGGGSGTGVSVSPVGFLVIHADGHVELLSLAAAEGQNDLASSIETIINKTPDLISKIKTAIASKKKKKEASKEEEAEAPAESTENSSETDTVQGRITD